MAIVQEAEQGIYEIVAKYLATGVTGYGGKMLHVAGIMTSAYANGSLMVGKIVPFFQLYVGQGKLGADAVAVTDTVMRGISAPNIEGIPIMSSKVSKQRQVDVSEQASIVQSATSKEYNVDNAVPRLRRWQIEGYLAVLQPAIDYMFTIKPSLLLQVAFLDACAASRVPVWFKDNNNEFFQVLITSLQTSQSPDITNAITISINLIEYKPYEVGEGNLTGQVAEKETPEAGEAAA